MIRMNWTGLACASLGVLLAGCAGVPPQRGTAEIDKLIAARGGAVPAWPDRQPAQTGASEALREPLTLGRAVELAFVRNPQIRATYAELGVAESDVLAASRPRNPRLGYVSLDEQGSGASQITRSVSLGFTDLLLLPARTRLADAELHRSRERIGAALLELESQVQTAWFEYVTAQQVAQMRETVAVAAETSAKFAQRLRDAGNLPAKALALELAAATEARVAASRSRADAVRARAALAGLLGVSLRESWDVPKTLPAPLAEKIAEEGVAERALQTRLDVSAARREVDVLSGALGLTRRWRWLGNVEVGYERESETDGSRLRGPSLSVEVPVFNQNRASVLRAQSRLEAARARLESLELGVRNEVAAGLDRLETTQAIAEAYRTALVPQREAIVARTQEEANYMLVGTFELIQARRAEFDAYQEYLEAVRDYWTARVDLRRAVGGALPGDETPHRDTIGTSPQLLRGQP